jgi:hypothetical protein
VVLKALLIMLLAVPGLAQDQGGPGVYQSACFHGQNDADSPATLPPCDSPDTLNVESNLQGTSAIKRDGYSKIADLTYSTSNVTGAIYYVDASGSRLKLVCHDKQCQKSANDNAFSTVFSTASSGVVRWSFVEAGGTAFGANNKYDPILSYDGTTLSYPAGMPRGSVLALANDRLVVVDIQGFPNRVWYSVSGDYDNFTVGVDPEDAFFDDLGAPGDKVRGAVCVNGLCYFFKTASITACEVRDQYTTECAVISPSIGTTSPGSIVVAGSVIYFESQEGTYWELSNSGLKDISRKIPALIKSKSGGLNGGERNNSQTTEGDWEAGTESPLLSWDTDSIPGTIFPSSVTFVDTSSMNFVEGVLTNISTNVIGAISLVQADTATFRNAGAEANSTSLNLATLTAWTVGTSGGYYGANFWTPAGSGETCGDASNLFTLRILDGTTEAELTRSTVNIVNSQAVTEYFVNTSTLAAHSIKIQANWGENTAHVYKSVPFIRPAGGVKYKLADVCGGSCCPAFDVDEGTFTLTGSIVSRAFDTNFSTPTWGRFDVSMSSSVIGVVNLETQTSSDGSSFDSLVSLNNSQKPTSSQKRHIKYKASFIVGASTDTSGIITNTDLPAATTGQFTSQCIQPNSAISSWGILSCATNITGNASVVYYATSAVSCATLPTTPPDTWLTTLANNATLTISTNTAYKFGFKSLLTSATEQAPIEACVTYWSEGAGAQPVWSIFDPIKNSVYWTATVDNSATTNRLLKYDRNLEAWFPFDIPAQAPFIANNSIYFGGATEGAVFKYGGVSSDDGQPINAYWQSKDIGSDRPFLEKDFQTYSLVARNNGSGVLYSTATLSNAETSVYSVTLSTGSGIQYIRSNNNLPRTSPQNFMNIKFGNNSSTPFEVLGMGVTWDALPWSVSEQR